MGWEDLGMRSLSGNTSYEGREIVRTEFRRSGVGRRQGLRMSLAGIVQTRDFVPPGATPPSQVQNPSLVLRERIIPIG